MVKWKSNNRFFKGVDAEQVYSEIQTIGEEYTAEDIVELAEDESTELHKCFEWDDTEAARKYRLYQARVMVAELVVVVEREEQEPTEFRVIQSQGRGKGFTKSTIIARDVDRYAELLKRAMAELDAFRKRYEGIVELEEVLDEIDKLLS